MNILMIAAGIPTESTPLSGIFAFDQAKALKEKGHNVIFFALDLRSVRHIRKIGIKAYKKDEIICAVASIPVGPVPVSVLCKIGSLVLNRLYYSIYFESKPDIIHAHFTEIGNMAVKLSKQIGVPLVITEHSSMIRNKQIRCGMNKCARQAYQGADIVISVSDALAKDIKHKMGFGSLVIPNIVDVRVFEYAAHKKNVAGFGIIAVGNLVEVKNHQMLIDSFQIFHKKYPDSYLGIVGNGPLKKTLIKQVHKEGLQNSVKFYGTLDRKDINKLFQEYDMFAFPSKSETFGVACIEAMASGLPVVAAKCGGPDDIINSDCGLLVSNNDRNAFSNALEYMYNNIQNYDREKISIYARKRFSPEYISERLLEAYHFVLR